MRERIRNEPSADEYAAAREYLEHDYTRHHLTGEPAQAAHRHANEIAHEHKRAPMIALAATSHELQRPPRHLREHQRRERRARGIDARQAAAIRRHGYEDRVPRRRSTREQLSDTVQHAGETTVNLVTSAGGAVADTGWGQLVGELFLWGIALSIGYLLLTGKGPKGVSKLFEGATNVTRAVISPAVDPLNPKGALP